jgi:ubiquinone/menaquinone biosynthesis C-methylase UbiE
MDQSTIRRMYDRFSSIPGFWELDAWTCRATARSPYRARVIQELGLEATSRVLDVACGTGLNFELLQHVVERTGRIVAIDSSGRTLERAHRQVARKGWGNVDLVEADAATYRPEQGFDAALCTFAIEIIPAWRETISMMVDAVKPGGRIGLIGFTPSTSRWPYAALNPLWRAAAVPFGGVDLGRDVRREVGSRCEEISYDEVYGGFYYLLVSARR